MGVYISERLHISYHAICPSLICSKLQFWVYQRIHSHEQPWFQWFTNATLIHLYQHPPTATQINIIVPVVPQMWWFHHMFLFSPLFVSSPVVQCLSRCPSKMHSLRYLSSCFDLAKSLSAAWLTWTMPWSIDITLSLDGRRSLQNAAISCRTWSRWEVFLSSPLIEWTRWRETLVPSSLLAFFVIIDVVLEEMIVRQFDRLTWLTMVDIAIQSTCAQVRYPF